MGLKWAARARRRSARAVRWLLVLLWVGSGPAVRLAPADGMEADGETTATPELLIRYEVGGGLLPPATPPRWSLYRDGLVVWTETREPSTPGFDQAVWVGNLSAPEVRDALAALDRQGFWTLDAEYHPGGASDDGRTVDLDASRHPDQRWSALSVRDGTRSKRVTVYPAHWEGVPRAFSSTKELVLAVRPPDAHPFEPRSFRLEARRLPSEGSSSADLVWPFTNLRLPAPKGELRLSREEGLLIAERLRHREGVVSQSAERFSVRLVGLPPRGY